MYLNPEEFNLSQIKNITTVDHHSNLIGGLQGQWEWELSKVTASGLRAILSSPWYLNYIR
jgi:hypothetical protein